VNAEEFRSDMMVRIRAFDRWTYKDQLSNPEDYANMQLGDWWQMFITFVEDDME
jgi:hypothetical protein